MVNWALQWRSEKDLGPLENVKEVGPSGGVLVLASSQENQSSHSESTGLHPSVGEELVRIPGSCLHCRGGKKRRSHNYHYSSSQTGDTLSQRQGVAYQLLETASVTSSFSQWTVWTWQSYGLPPQTFMSFRVLITSQRSSLTPKSVVRHCLGAAKSWHHSSA